MESECLEVGLTGMDCKEALGRDWHVPALAGPDSTAALILLQGIVYHDAALSVLCAAAHATHCVPCLLMELVACWRATVCRHPVLRTPLPPPPVNFVWRLPTRADTML